MEEGSGARVRVSELEGETVASETRVGNEGTPASVGQASPQTGRSERTRPAGFPEHQTKYQLLNYLTPNPRPHPHPPSKRQGGEEKMMQAGTSHLHTRGWRDDEWQGERVE